MGFFGTSRKKHVAVERDNSTIYVNMDQHCSELPVAVPVVESTFLSEPPIVDSSSSAPVEKTAATASSSTWIPHFTSPPPPHRHRTAAAAATLTQRSPTVLAACPFCGTPDATTRTVAIPDIWTLLAVVLIVIVFWPLFWVPLVWNVCKTVLHYCTSCGAQVGRVPAFQDFCVERREGRRF